LRAQGHDEAHPFDAPAARHEAWDAPPTRHKEEQAVGDQDQRGKDPTLDESSSDDDLIQSREDGQLHFIKETQAHTFPVTAPANATPLEEDEPEGTIPPSPLWAMKDRRHEQWTHLFGHPDRIRAALGTGDATVYAIDDGRHHCMIGRRVGVTTDGTVYSLVGRVTKDTYERLASGGIDGSHAFRDASDVSLLGTAEAPGVSNVFDVDFYGAPDEIPTEYLPPAAFIQFAEDLPTADR
jgi:hypothetical protein